MLTKRHKSFPTRKATPIAESDLDFELGDQTYVCYQEIQGSVILNFIAAADESPAKAGAQIMEFFKHALPPEEHAKFLVQVESPEEIIEMETLSEIVSFLIGEYTTGRPTQASESSDAGS